MICPCCSTLKYEDCCGLYHRGKTPPNALALMRSRYSAYACKLPEYIIKTTHHENSSFTNNKKKWVQDILTFCNHTVFEKLEIKEFIDGEDVAYVSFLAHLKQDEMKIPHFEKSLFKKVNGVWLYHSYLETE
jgi:SEC-C motif-containing protein